MKFLRYIFRYEFQYWDHKWRQPEGLKLLYVSKKDRHATLRSPHLCDEAKVAGEGIQAVYVLEVGA
jgi:hypothetical protein